MFLLIQFTASIRPSGNFVMCCGTIQKLLDILRPSRECDIDSSRGSWIGRKLIVERSRTSRKPLLKRMSRHRPPSRDSALGNEKPLTIRAQVENLANRRYWVSAFSGGLVASGARVVNASIMQGDFHVPTRCLP
jgi:hypothetical protein